MTESRQLFGHGCHNEPQPEQARLALMCHGSWQAAPVSSEHPMGMLEVGVLGQHMQYIKRLAMLSTGGTTLPSDCPGAGGMGSFQALPKPALWSTRRGTPQDATHSKVSQAPRPTSSREISPETPQGPRKARGTRSSDQTRERALQVDRAGLRPRTQHSGEAWPPVMPQLPPPGPALHWRCNSVQVQLSRAASC